jgi:hypothetical protein
VAIPQPKLRIQTSDSKDKRKVVLKPMVTTFAVYESESGSYCGLLEPTIAAVVQELLNSSHIQVFASIESNSLKLTIYGAMEDSEFTANELSVRGLYLQQPQLKNESSEYFNPHYLIRPGSTFQEATEEVPVTTQRLQMISSSVKFDVYHLFDSATASANFVEASVSGRLKTNLKQ